MDPKMGNLGEPQQRAEPAGALLKALVSKMAPRWLKMASSSPRRPKSASRGTQDGPRGLQELLQEGPPRPKPLIFHRFLNDFSIYAFSAFRRPKVAQEAPKIVPRSPKRPPRWPHDGPRSVQGHPKGRTNVLNDRKILQDGSRWPPRRPFWSPRRLRWLQDAAKTAQDAPKTA